MEASPLRFFVSKYGELPSIRSAGEHDGERLQRELLARFGPSVEFFRTMDAMQPVNDPFLDCGWWLGMDGVLVVSDAARDELHVMYLPTKTERAAEVSEVVAACLKQLTEDTPRVHVVSTSMHGLIIVPLQVKKPKLSIRKHYNDDFEQVHRTIFRRLNRTNDKGIVLLHGLPGTGKTTYLRYLVSRLKKRVIFIPPGFADRLTDPAFMSLLLDYPNSVLVIEDAERVLADREREGHSAVSVLLNLSDGLLSDCLNMQLICTFNTHLSRIDQALLRQGRLIARYCFRELEPAKAGALLVGQGKPFEEERPMTLAEVFGEPLPSVSELPGAKGNIGFHIQKAG